MHTMQLKPSSIYLEEDVTKNAEFPEDGRFDVLTTPGNRYKVCGDSENTSSDSGNADERVDSPSVRPMFTGSGQWSVPRPWQQQPEVTQGAGHSSSSRKKSSSVHYESSLKRSIPHVSLCLDDSGRNMCVDSIISNVYIKIPDSNVSLQTILSEVAAKIGESPNDLILLDSKFIEIGDDSRGMSN